MSSINPNLPSEPLPVEYDNVSGEVRLRLENFPEHDTSMFDTNQVGAIIRVASPGIITLLNLERQRRSGILDDEPIHINENELTLESMADAINMRHAIQIEEGMRATGMLVMLDTLAPQTGKADTATSSFDAWRSKAWEFWLPSQLRPQVIKTTPS